MEKGSKSRSERVHVTVQATSTMLSAREGGSHTGVDMTGGSCRELLPLEGPSAVAFAFLPVFWRFLRLLGVPCAFRRGSSNFSWLGDSSEDNVLLSPVWSWKSLSVKEASCVLRAAWEG